MLMTQEKYSEQVFGGGALGDTGLSPTGEICLHKAPVFKKCARARAGILGVMTRTVFVTGCPALPRDLPPGALNII